MNAFDNFHPIQDVGTMKVPVYIEKVKVPYPGNRIHLAVTCNLLAHIDKSVDNPNILGIKFL